MGGGILGVGGGVLLQERERKREGERSFEDCLCFILFYFIAMKRVWLREEVFRVLHCL